MVENKTLVVVGILGTIVTVGTAAYFLTRKPKDEAPPGIPEEIPFEPSVPEIADPGAAFTGVSTGFIGGFPVAPAFAGW